MCSPQWRRWRRRSGWAGLALPKRPPNGQCQPDCPLLLWVHRLRTCPATLRLQQRRRRSGWACRPGCRCRQRCWRSWSDSTSRLCSSRCDLVSISFAIVLKLATLLHQDAAIGDTEAAAATAHRDCAATVGLTSFVTCSLTHSAQVPWFSCDKSQSPEMQEQQLWQQHTAMTQQQVGSSYQGQPHVPRYT